MGQYKLFETERLLLKATTEEDANYMLEVLNTPKWLEFIGDRNVKTIDDAKKYIREKLSPQLKKLGYANFTVIRKTDGVKMGSCGLYDREGVDGIDIGFAFLPQYENMGYAFEAATKIKEAAFNEFNLNKISAITTKKNEASQKLLEKLGLQFTRFVYIPNDEEELLLYELKLEN